MKKLFCVALLCVCTVLTACGSKDVQFDGNIADKDGIVTEFDNTNVSIEVAAPTPTPTLEPVVTPEPTSTPEPLPVFVEDGTVYTLEIAGIEYTGTITEIISQLPTFDDGTYYIHVPNICSVIVDSYGLPSVLFDIAQKVAEASAPEEYNGYTPTVADAQELIDKWKGTGFNATNYEILAAYHPIDPTTCFEKVLDILYLDLDTNTYCIFGWDIPSYDIGATSLEEAYEYCKTAKMFQSSASRWTYFK